MAEIKVKDDKAHCEKCGIDVQVKEKPGVYSSVQYPHVLIDDSGHVVAERETENEPWQKPT